MLSIAYIPWSALCISNKTSSDTSLVYVHFGPPPSFYQNVFVSHCCHIVSTSEQQWTFRRSRLKIRWTIKELTQGRWNTDLFIYFVMLWYGLTRKGCGHGEGGWGWGGGRNFKRHISFANTRLLFVFNIVWYIFWNHGFQARNIVEYTIQISLTIDRFLIRFSISTSKVWFSFWVHVLSIIIIVYRILYFWFISDLGTKYDEK